MSEPMVEHWGDEGELHVAIGWTRKAVVLEATDDYVRSGGDDECLREFRAEVGIEDVRHGWAIIVPSKDEYGVHPLHKGYYDDGQIVLGSLLHPPFFIYRDSRRLHVLLPKPATWVRDH